MLIIFKLDCTPTANTDIEEKNCLWLDSGYRPNNLLISKMLLQILLAQISSLIHYALLVALIIYVYGISNQQSTR